MESSRPPLPLQTKLLLLLLAGWSGLAVATPAGEVGPPFPSGNLLGSPAFDARLAYGGKLLPPDKQRADQGYVYDKPPQPFTYPTRGTTTTTTTPKPVSYLPPSTTTARPYTYTTPKAVSYLPPSTTTTTARPYTYTTPKPVSYLPPSTTTTTSRPYTYTTPKAVSYLPPSTTTTTARPFTYTTRVPVSYLPPSTTTTARPFTYTTPKPVSYLPPSTTTTARPFTYTVPTTTARPYTYTFATSTPRPITYLPPTTTTVRPYTYPSTTTTTRPFTYSTTSKPVSYLPPVTTRRPVTYSTTTAKPFTYTYPTTTKRPVTYTYSTTTARPVTYTTRPTYATTGYTTQSPRITFTYPTRPPTTTARPYTYTTTTRRPTFTTPRPTPPPTTVRTAPPATGYSYPSPSVTFTYPTRQPTTTTTTTTTTTAKPITYTYPTTTFRPSTYSTFRTTGYPTVSPSVTFTYPTRPTTTTARPYTFTTTTRRPTFTTPRPTYSTTTLRPVTFTTRQPTFSTFRPTQSTTVFTGYQKESPSRPFTYPTTQRPFTYSTTTVRPTFTTTTTRRPTTTFRPTTVYTTRLPTTTLRPYTFSTTTQRPTFTTPKITGYPKETPSRPFTYPSRPPTTTTSRPYTYTTTTTLRPVTFTTTSPRPTYTTPRPTFTTPRPTYTTVRYTYTTPRPTYTTPRPTYTTQRPVTYPSTQTVFTGYPKESPSIPFTYPPPGVPAGYQRQSAGQPLSYPGLFPGADFDVRLLKKRSAPVVTEELLRKERADDGKRTRSSHGVLGGLLLADIRYRPEKHGGGRYRDDPRRWELQESVPGEPGEDYPVYATIPTTSFSCQGRSEGYHADPEARCQVFHVCAGPSPVPKSSALCPNGSVFNQAIATCDWWSNVDCPGSAVFRAGRPFLPIPEYSGNLVLSQAERLVSRPQGRPGASRAAADAAPAPASTATSTAASTLPAQRTSGAEEREGALALSTGLEPPLEAGPSLQQLEPPAAAAALQLSAFSSSYSHASGYLPPGDDRGAEVIIPTPGGSAGSTVRLSGSRRQKVGAPALSLGRVPPSTTTRPATLTEGPSPLPEAGSSTTSPKPDTLVSSTPSPVASQSARPTEEYTGYPPSAAYSVSTPADVLLVSSTPSPLPVTSPATVETLIPSSTPAPSFFTTVSPLALNTVSGAAPGFTQTVVSSTPYPVSNGSPESLQELRTSSPVQRLNDILVSSTPFPPSSIYYTGNGAVGSEVVDSGHLGLSVNPTTADDTIFGDLKVSSSPVQPLANYFSRTGTSVSGDILLASTPAPPLPKYFSGTGTTEASDVPFSSTPAPPPAIYFTGNGHSETAEVDIRRVGLSAKPTMGGDTVVGDLQQSSTPVPPLSNYFAGTGTSGSGIVDSAAVTASTTPTTVGDAVLSGVSTSRGGPSTNLPDLLAINDATQSTAAPKQYSSPSLPPLAILGRDRVSQLNRFISFRPSPAISDLLLPYNFVSSSPSPFSPERTSAASSTGSEQPVTTPATLVYTDHSLVVPPSGSPPQTNLLPHLPVESEIKFSPYFQGPSESNSALPRFRYGETLSGKYSTSLPEPSPSPSPEVYASKQLTGGNSVIISSSPSFSDSQISDSQGDVLQQLTQSPVISSSLPIRDGSSTHSPETSGYFAISDQPATTKQQGRVSVQILSSPDSTALPHVEGSYSSTGSAAGGASGGASGGAQAVRVEVVPSLPAYVPPQSSGQPADSGSEQPRPSTPSPFRLPGGLRVVVPDTLYGVPVAGRPPQPSPDVDQPPLLVPAISFSFDTPQGRQEFEAAVAAGLLDSSKR